MPRRERGVLNPVTFEEIRLAVVELTDLGGAFAIAALESGRHAIHRSLERLTPPQ
jgi:hypothetical protein